MKVLVNSTPELPGLNNIVIYVLEVKLNETAKIKVIGQDITNAQLAEWFFNLTQEEYDEWGPDDDYIAAIALKRLSLVDPSIPTDGY